MTGRRIAVHVTFGLAAVGLYAVAVPFVVRLLIALWHSGDHLADLLGVPK